MKYCLKCGHVLPDIAAYCPICGAKQIFDEEEKVVVTQEQPKVEEKPVAPVKEEKPAGKKDLKSIIYFLLHKDVVKFSLIFLGALLGLSLLIWILSTLMKFGFFFKLLLFLLSGAFAARIIYLLIMEIKTNKTSDMFNLLLKGGISLMHVALFIMNFIFMVV